MEEMDKKMPKVSIVLPVYNGEKFLIEALKSVQQQTMENWELIIINDCSTDGTDSIVRDAQKTEKRIRYYVNECNLKLPASLNKGFRNALGQYYTWISDDNILEPDFLETLSCYLDEHPNIGLVYSDMDLIDGDGNIIKQSKRKEPEWLPVGNEVGASFMYRSDVAEKVGEYDTSFFLVEDYEYWLRMYLMTDVAHIAKRKYKYRLHSESLTEKKKREILEKNHELRKKYFQELKNRIINSDILGEFFLTSHEYGVKVEFSDEFKIARNNISYIKRVLYEELRRMKRKITWRKMER